ncbi:MAG: hypothetical protein HYW05_02520 [Candidatus Diapherotrites archaeon]|nr:hypothetical protein [Candidatus Diapherotrites archaeon]
MVHRKPEARRQFFKRNLNKKGGTERIAASIADRLEAMHYKRGIALKWLHSLGLKKLNCEKILDMRHQAGVVLPTIEKLIALGNVPKLRESLRARIEECKDELKSSHSERRKDLTAEIAILNRLLTMLSTGRGG